MSKKMQKKSPSPGARGRSGGKTSARTGKHPSRTPERQTAAGKAAQPAKRPPAKAPALTDGARAPAFRLQRDGGAEIALSDYEGRKLVIFFYPRANTPGCTREAIDFTRLSGMFAAAGTAILGVSADSLRTQETFRDKHALSVPLLSDPTHRMLEAYGVWGEKSLYGKTFLGILRTTVLIDGAGRIHRIWRNVRVDGHAEEVLEAARKL
ncbi:MAG TPA: peroxiredoxin [Nitrobacter sp.]|nr:peroxiredoxin [Nitrobacter sp.]